MPTDGIQRTFGEVVREARAASGISQEELAEKAGLHRTYVSLLERGQRNPTLLVIEALSHALEMPMSDIIKRVEVRHPWRR